MILKKFDDLIIPTEEIWGNLNYKNIPHKNKLNCIVRNKKLIHKFDDDIDNSMLHALNYYDNFNLFPIFGKNKALSYQYYLSNFKDDYILYGIKHMTISSLLIKKIMYQLLFARMIIKTKRELYDFLDYQYKFLARYSNPTIDVTVLLVCKRDLNKKYPLNDIIDNNFCVYIPNTKEQIWNCACVFFSSSTLKFLELQNFDYFLTKDNENSKKMFLKYRKWLNLNIGAKYQQQYMLYSSVVLYLLGHRSMNDLDLYVHTIPKDLEEKTNEFKTNEVFNFIDFKIKNTDNWPRYWNTWLDEWSHLCGAKYFEELLANPKYHFYFLGVKVISVDCDVQRRLHRNRPRAYADLLALRKRYPYKINIPPVPSQSIKYIDILDKDETEINKLLRDGGVLDEKNNEICIKYNNDISKFINTIIYALSIRYRMTFTVDEIKRELNMRTEIVRNIKQITIKIHKNDESRSDTLLIDDITQNKSKKIKVIIKKN